MFNENPHSVTLIIFVLVFVAPLIVFLTVKTSISGEAFIEGIAQKSQSIAKEQRRSEKLILRLLPPSVASRLIEQKRVSFTYDASTIMFCSLYGFTDIIMKSEPLRVTF